MNYETFRKTYQADDTVLAYRRITAMVGKLIEELRNPLDARALASIVLGYRKDDCAMLLKHLKANQRSDKSLITTLREAKKAFHDKAETRANMLASLYLRRN